MEVAGVRVDGQAEAGDPGLAQGAGDRLAQEGAGQGGAVLGRAG
jgi:hypothetical protein